MERRRISYQLKRIHDSIQRIKSYKEIDSGLKMEIRRLINKIIDTIEELERINIENFFVEDQRINDTSYFRFIISLFYLYLKNMEIGHSKFLAGSLKEFLNSNIDFSKKERIINWIFSFPIIRTIITDILYSDLENKNLLNPKHIEIYNKEKDKLNEILKQSSKEMISFIEMLQNQNSDIIDPQTNKDLEKFKSLLKDFENGNQADNT